MIRPRRRSAAAGKSEIDEERGFAMRILLHSPKDLLAGVLSFAAVISIVANAMFMQSCLHPSPKFGSSVTMPLTSPQANPLPRPRPVEADAVDVGAAESHANAGDPPANLAKPAASPHAASGHSSRSAAPTPATSAHSDPVADLINATRRVAAVQRTLTEYGYGQLKPTGTVGTDTQAAIRKFAQARRLPVTGQMSDRLVREPVALTGRPID